MEITPPNSLLIKMKFIARKNKNRSFWAMGFLCLTVNFAHAQTYIRTVFAIPETGITKGYTDTFGEDNDVFTQSIKLQNINDNIVFDSTTKLMWQRGDGGEMTYWNAKHYCDTLTLGGFTDWRLPTPLEAYSIIHLEKNNPSLDVNYFKITGAEYWYTAITQQNDTTKVWVTNSGGGIGNHPRSETISSGGTKKFHVRAVRNSWSDTFTEKFTITSTGLVLDNRSNLSWIVFPDSISATWTQALVFANHFTSKKCHVPNIKELQSLADYQMIQPCIDKSIFPSTSTSKYWSSSTLFNQASRAWYMDAKFGITTYSDKVTKLNLALVCENSPQAGINNATLVKSTFELYPNPTQDFLNFQYSNFDEILKNIHYLLVIGLDGRTLRLEPTSLIRNKDHLQIDVRNLNTGIYILKAIGNSNQILDESFFIIAR